MSAMLRTLITTALAVAALVGCQSAIRSTTSYDVLFRSGVLSEFGYAASDGRMPVIVIGNPFELPQAAVDEAVIAAMQGNNNGPAVRFFGAPPEVAQSGRGYAVIVLLNAAPGSSPDVVCSRRSTLATQAMTDRTTLLAAFCGNGDARSWAYSSTSPIESPTDPRLRMLVAQTTRLMVPNRDDDWNRGTVQQ